MPINLESTLQGIRRGAAAPGVPGTLAGQIRAQKQKQQRQQFEMQRGLQELMMKQRQQQIDAQRNAVQSARDQAEIQEMLRNMDVRDNLGFAERLVGMDPNRIRQRIQQNPQGRLAAYLASQNIDPTSPTLGQDIKRLRNSLYARSEGKIFEPAEQEEISSTAHQLGIAEAMDLDPSSEIKYVGEAPYVNQEGEVVNKRNIRDMQRTGPQQEARSPFAEAKTSALESELKLKQEQRGSARETQQLTAGLTDLVVRGDVKTGAIQPAVTGLQNLAQSIGVDLKSFAEGMGINLGDLSKKEEFDRLSQRLTINQFEKFKGNLNQKEVEIAQDSVAQLGTSKEGNVEAIAALRASSMLAERRANRLLGANTEEEYQNIQEEIQEAGTDEYRALRDEIRDQIKQEMKEKPIVKDEEQFSLDNPARPTTVEEFENLPEGTPYIHPDDGNLYRKK